MSDAIPPRHLATVATAMRPRRGDPDQVSRFDRPSVVAVVFLAGCLLLALGGAIDEPAQQRQRALERVGIPVVGVVESTSYDPKVPDAVQVSFEWEGQDRSVRLRADGFDRGQRITLLVDPHDPRRVTIEGHRQQSVGAFAASLYLAIAGLIGWALAAWIGFRVVRRKWRSRRARRSLPGDLGSRKEHGGLPM